ncbi:MAG TPA: response regulator, partial [Minicystis sp.]|nr:response regulator [Minicystis sp.]
MSRRILVVEEDPSARRAITQLLKLDGFDVVAAATPSRARPLLAMVPFAGVVAAAEAPGIDLVALFVEAALSQPAAAFVLAADAACLPPLLPSRVAVVPTPLDYDELALALRRRPRSLAGLGGARVHPALAPLEGLAASWGVGALVVDPDGQVVAANAAAAELFAAPPGELLGPIVEFPRRFEYREQGVAHPPPVALAALAGARVAPIARSLRAAGATRH